MTTRIAIDCMGGDHGPSVTVPAALRFLREDPAVELILVGQEALLRPLLLGEEGNARLRLQHASEVIGMDEAPAQALRSKKDASMRVALNLVKAGEADACVSAGNTGALMAISRFVLKMLPGIDRPALCPILPTADGGHVHMLDLGANVDCSAQDLLQFGVMGAMLAAAVDHLERPRVGLLNIGSEEIKGNEVVKEAGRLLKASGLNFVGNVALKASEGVAQMLASLLKTEFSRNPLTKLAALVALPVLRRFKQRLDPRRYNGAVLLGLKGVSVKSHGSADALSFYHALARARDAAQNRVVERIAAQLAQLPATDVTAEVS